MTFAEDAGPGYLGGASMTKPGDQNDPRGFFLSKAGQLTLLGAVIIVLLVFALSHVW